MGITRRAATVGLLAASLPPALAAQLPRAVPSKGFALPGWLAETPVAPAPAVLDRLRDFGFETIRLPIDPAFVAPETLPHVATTLATVTAHGFSALLDMHPGRYADDGARLDAAWRLLAPVLADTAPERVYAELLNEPAMAPADWLGLRERLAETVRRAAPGHTLVWGPARYQGIWELDAIPPLADANSLAAIHYYWPMGFTHQGASWDESALARFGGLPFPAELSDPAVQRLMARLDAADRAALREQFLGPWTTATIADEFATAAAWSARTGVPLLLGEFGVLGFDADTTSRANWLRAVRREAERAGMGWMHWEADLGFGFMADRARDDAYDLALIEALLA
jgi:endoglucanase